MDLNRLFRYAVVAAGLSASLVMVPLVPAQATPASPGHSTTFAGYQDPTTTTKATASDSFVAPTLTCPSSSEQSGLPIGAGMVTSSTWDSGAVLVFGCNGTTPAYEAAFFVNGRLIAAHFIPNAGDVLHASAAESATSTRLVLKDVTQGISDTKARASGAAVLPVVGAFSLSGNLSGTPIPNFGKVRISGAKLDGSTPQASSAVAYDLYSSTSQLQIATSALSPRGNAFSVTFKHS